MTPYSAGCLPAFTYTSVANERYPPASTTCPSASAQKSSTAVLNPLRVSPPPAIETSFLAIWRFPQLEIPSFFSILSGRLVGDPSIIDSLLRLAIIPRLYSCKTHKTKSDGSQQSTGTLHDACELLWNLCTTEVRAAGFSRDASSSCHIKGFYTWEKMLPYIRLP